MIALLPPDSEGFRECQKSLDRGSRHLRITRVLTACLVAQSVDKSRTQECSVLSGPAAIDATFVGVNEFHGPVHARPEVWMLAVVVAPIMAMKYGKREKPVFGPNMQKSLGSIPVFIYHVEEVEIFEELSKLPNVRVLMHGDHSVNYFRNNSCSQ